MIELLQRFRYYYFPIYCFAFYSFFIHLTYKTDPYRVSNGVELRSSLSDYSTIEIRSTEVKMILDLKYRNKMNSHPLTIKSFLCTIDLEGKIVGHRSIYDEKFRSHTINTTINFNKKLLQSTLFGSIKLIRI